MLYNVMLLGLKLGKKSKVEVEYCVMELFNELEIGDQALKGVN